ncbi:MAG: NAD(P)-dependent oxidoreductase [Burkholderiaceae bacterium]
MTNPTQVGLAGVGTMGRGLARNVVAKGHALKVFDTSARAVESAVELGAKPAASVAELAQTCDVVLTCLPSLAAIRAVYLEPGGLLESAHRGAVLVDLSTGEPSLARECARRAAQAGVDYLDSPMLRNPEAAWNGMLHLIVGGEVETLERVRPVLESVAERVLHVGPTGAGQVLKLINNAVTISNTAILCEVFNVARAQSVDLALLADVLGTSMAGSKVLPTVAKRLIGGDHSPLFATDVVKKDISLYTSLASESGCMVPIGESVRDLVRLASGLGFGAEHYTRIVTVLERARGLE